MCLKTWVCTITYMIYVTNHNSFAVACITINYTDVQNATIKPLNLFFLFFFFKKQQQPCSFFRVGEGGAGIVPEGHWLQDSRMAPFSSTFIPNKGKTVAEDTLWCWECFPLQRVQVQHAPVPGRQQPLAVRGTSDGCWLPPAGQVSGQKQLYHVSGPSLQQHHQRRRHDPGKHAGGE